MLVGPAQLFHFDIIDDWRYLPRGHPVSFLFEAVHIVVQFLDLLIRKQLAGKWRAGFKS
jgi:hypothetical protein